MSGQTPQTATATRLIWTESALARWRNGKSDPRHTISAPNIADVYDGFVRQLRRGTPWALVGPDDAVIASGTAGFDGAAARA